MPNVFISEDTLADLVRSADRFGFDAVQFHNEVWALRAESFSQLVTVGRTFLASYEHLEGTTAVQAVRKYLYEYRREEGEGKDKVTIYGDPASAVKPVLEAALALKKAVKPSEVIDNLIGAARRCSQLHELYSGKLFAFQNRCRHYADMRTHGAFPALEGTFTVWADSLGLLTPSLPERPFTRYSNSLLSANTLNNAIERGKVVSEKINAFADHILALKLVSYEQLGEACKPFQSSEMRWTLVGEAAHQFLTNTSDRDTKVKDLLDVAQNYQKAIKNSSEITALIEIAKRSWEIARLTVQTEPLRALADKYHSLREISEFRALATVFYAWQASQESACV
jgi:hypothetical protein